MTESPFSTLPVGAEFSLENEMRPFWRKAGERYAVALHNGTMTIAPAPDRLTYTD